MAETLRVGVATSDGAFGAALCTFLGAEGDMVAMGPVACGDGLVDAATADSLDVAVIEWRVDGARAAVEALAGSVPALVLGDIDPDVVVAVFDAGAASYVDQQSSFEEIRDAIRHLVQGHAVVPPPLLGVLLRNVIDRRRGEREARAALDVLTSREREVFTLMGGGANNAEIAGRLFISPATARTHVQRVFKKLGLHSRAEAIAFAIRCGMYPTDRGAGQ